LNLKQVSFKYPFSKKYVLFSSALVILAIVFVFLGLNDIVLILLFFVYLSFSTIFFLVLKFRLYSRKMENRLQSEYIQEPSRRETGFLVILLIMLLIGMLAPFLLLLFLSPSVWFILIIGFVASINIPEIILYIYSCRIENLRTK
jgi:hypothetical protein